MPAAAPTGLLSIPGESPEQVAAISARCLGSGAVQGRPNAKVYNIIRDRFGATALVYADDARTECVVDRSGEFTSAGLRDRATPTAWLPGPASLDTVQPAPADVLSSVGGPPVTPSTLYGGRVTRGVAKVVLLTPDGGPVTVRPVNGTFLLRVFGPAQSAAVEVVGYDARDREVGRTSTQLEELCFTTPSGQLIGVRQPGGCSRAVRWR